MEQIFYGLDLQDIGLTDNEKHSFARSLFLVQSLTTEDVAYLYKNMANISVKNLLTLLNELAKETADFRKLLKEYTSWQKQFRQNETLKEFEVYKSFLYKKVTEWNKYFGNLENQEVMEYCEFYELDPRALITDKENKSTGKFNSPADIKSILDKYVIGQEEAKRIISFAFYLHLLSNNFIVPDIYKKRTPKFTEEMKLPEAKVLLIGPTGTGKTFIIKTLSKMLQIPFVKVDCAKLVCSGYMGSNLDDALTQLYLQAGSDRKKAERGIIYFDEFDKISEYHYQKIQGSIGGIELQQEFLSLIEDSERIINKEFDRSNSNIKIRLNTSNIMYIFSGSFSGIEEIVNKRKKEKGGIGFGHPITGYEKGKTDNYKDLIPEDFVNFGIIPELVGRLSYFVSLKSLTREQIIDIIKLSEDSGLKAFSNFFHIHYNQLEIEECVYSMIADKVIELSLGARTIKTILTNLLEEALFQAPENIDKTFRITGEDFQRIINNRN